MGPMEKQNHEDDPRGICSLLELITPFVVHGYFFFVAFLAFLAGAFFFAGMVESPSFLFMNESTPIENRPAHPERIIW